MGVHVPQPRANLLPGRIELGGRLFQVFGKPLLLVSAVAQARRRLFQLVLDVIQLRIDFVDISQYGVGLMLRLPELRSELKLLISKRFQIPSKLTGRLGCMSRSMPGMVTLT
jgi:hypothetical protein